MRSSVCWINIKSVIILLEKGTQECSETNITIFFFTNDLMKSMPYDFVNSLKDGKWTKLDNKWLTDVKKTLKQAESTSIKDMKLVRKIMTSDLIFTESTLLNEANDHIYEVTLDNVSQSRFYVNYAQILDVIGEEGWMKGDFNCISNIGSTRKVTLSWGAKNNPALVRN